MSIRPMERAPDWGVALLILLGVWVGVQYGTCTQDAAFASLRCATPLLQGEGLATPVCASVSPLWTLLIAAAAAVGGHPVTMSRILGLISLVVGAGLTAWACRGRGGAMMLAVALLALDPLLALEAVSGGEGILLMALVAAGLGLVVRGRSLGLGVVMGLACLVRPEGVVVCGLLYGGLLLAPRPDVSHAIRRVGAAAMLPVVAIGLLLVWRGQVDGGLLSWGSGGLGAERMLARAISSPLLFGLLALRPAMGTRSPGTLPAAAITIAAFIGEGLLGAEDAGRFIVPATPAMVLLATEAAIGLQARLSRAILPVLAAVLLVYGGAQRHRVGQPRAEQRAMQLVEQRLVGDWIRHHTPERTTIALHVDGAVPFYADRPIIAVQDMMAGAGPWPDLYLPGEPLLSEMPRSLPPGPGFPADFADRYRQRTVHVEGRWMVVWIRRDFMGGVWGR